MERKREGRERKKKGREREGKAEPELLLPPRKKFLALLMCT